VAIQATANSTRDKVQKQRCSQLRKKVSKGTHKQLVTDGMLIIT